MRRPANLVRPAPRRCMVDGCHQPRRDLFCASHKAQWEESPERVRARSLARPTVGTTALADFARRVSLEQRGGAR